MTFWDKLAGTRGETDPSPLREIDAITAREWHERGRCRLIDVREESEYQAERISGACLAPLSRLEEALPTLRPGELAVFLCRSGARTRIHAARLAGCGFAEAYVLGGGLMAWKAQGFPTECG